MICIAPGWGSGAYGTSPWGGGLGALPGGPIPTVNPFDIYCVGPCGPMSVILTYDEVSEFGGAGALLVDPITQDQLLSSGGANPTTDAYLLITTSVPQQFTLDLTCEFHSLPTNFADLVHRHIFFGVTDAAGPCAGLFFSKVGIGYVGAVHFDGSDNLVLDSTFEQLPNSQTLVSEGEYWSFRLAADLGIGVVYIYITKTSELVLSGHQLRYVLPLIPASALATPPTDRTTVSVRGSLGQPSVLGLDSICLASGFIIPNIPPTADAGLDQAGYTCAIFQLDGRRSFDPEGVPVNYQWRLIDAPLASEFVTDGLDGLTIPLGSPTGFTNLFYSLTLSDLNDVSPLLAGDVLVVGGVVYNVSSTGVDLSSNFYVQIDFFLLPDNLLHAPFKYLRQGGISNSDTYNPTFYPDLPGLYKFDLIVFDGALYSPPSVTIVNVTESHIPRGCVPDVGFLWNYLSDFWKLVEEKERIQTFWSAMAQVAASELLNLWQIDYAKSLRDIQRTFQRRWLHYDLVLKEPLPDLTTVRPIFEGLRQIFPVGGLSGIVGTTLTIDIPLFNADLSTKSGTITFTGSDPLTATDVSDQLTPFLATLDKRFVVRVTTDNASVNQELRIEAPFNFRTGLTDNAPIFVTASNMVPMGSFGAGVGVKTYRTDLPLANLGIREGDILALTNGTIVEIARIRGVVTDASDTWPYQRLVLLDEISTVPPNGWTIFGKVTSTKLNFYEELCFIFDEVTFDVFEESTGFEDSVVTLGAAVPASEPQSFGVELYAVANYINHPTRSFSVTFRELGRLSYIPIDASVVDIPRLQEKINTPPESAIFRRNIDYYIDSFRGIPAIKFAYDGPSDHDIWESTSPPDMLWAETTYFDNEPVIEQNFGIPVGFTLDDRKALPANVDYLSAVRGFWYTYYNGPTLHNLRVGSQILLGLPFVEEAGTIVEIRSDVSPTYGRILIQDTVNKEIVRSYTYPVALALETNPSTGSAYAVGDTVNVFAPLVTGVEVIDYVKDPHWFQGYLNQGLFYEPEKYFKFLVRVDAAAFNLSAMLFVRIFILRIKPTYTYPLFIVLRKVDDTEVSTTDHVEMSGTLLLFDGACYQDNGLNTYGVATMFDEPNSAGGGWKSKFDADPVSPDPTFPTEESVIWGFDKNYLCPEDFIFASSCVTFAIDTLPSFDSIFAWDMPVYSTPAYSFEDSWVTHIHGALGLDLYPPVGASSVVSANGTLTNVEIRIVGSLYPSPASMVAILSVNGVFATSSPFTQDSVDPFIVNALVNVPVLIGDELTVRIAPLGVGDIEVFWESITVTFGQAVVWAYDVELPAATYCTYKTL